MRWATSLVQLSAIFCSAASIRRGIKQMREHMSAGIETSTGIETIRQFIVDKQSEPVVFSDADDLIENGLVDSLQFTEFVLLIAEWSGQEISLDTLNIDDFRSISSIRKAFFM